MRRLLPLFICLPAYAQLLTLNSPQLNQAYLLNVPPPPCSQTLATTMAQSSGAFDQAGNTLYLASPFLTTNLANTTPACMAMVVATNGPTSATYQWAIYNDTTPSGNPGTVNGSFSASYNATALSASLTTNNYTINVATPLSSSAITNWIVFKVAGGTGNNDFRIGNWNPTGTGRATYFSSDGTTWTLANSSDQWLYTFFK